MIDWSSWPEKWTVGRDEYGLVIAVEDAHLVGWFRVATLDPEGELRVVHDRVIPDVVLGVMREMHEALGRGCPWKMR